MTIIFLNSINTFIKLRPLEHLIIKKKTDEWVLLNELRIQLS